MYFKRNITKQLLEWKNSPFRKPLVLKGARQVGKTTVLKEFGANNYKDTAYFNFEEQPELKQFFENTKDIKRVLQNLSLVHGKAIDPVRTIIIFDEIQECNEALNMLKYFNENAPEYCVVAAGSLLGIYLGKESSFPVGKVDFINIYPLTFSEFLGGAQQELLAYLESIDRLEIIPDIFFNNLVQKFKMYFISGGMPEAAKSLVEEQNISLSDRNLKNILNAYSLDFSHHASYKDISKINYVWDSIPSQLGRENKKFLYQTVRPGARAREYEDALRWLSQAGLVYRVNRCKKPALPISAYDDLAAFKLYLLDVGLLRRQSYLDPISFKEGNRLFTEFKGSLTENFVLQSLIPQFDAQPKYWTSEGKAEIDFLIQYKNYIIPIEVKSDENIRSKSLAYYNKLYAPDLRIRFSLRNLDYNEGLINIPLFMADFTSKLIDLAFKDT